jgi:hypothetical protein
MDRLQHSTVQGTYSAQDGHVMHMCWQLAARMQAAASHISLAQLALLSQHLSKAINALGWQLSQLELELHLCHTNSAAPLMPSGASVDDTAPSAPVPPDALAKDSIQARLAAALAAAHAPAASMAHLPLLVFRVRGEVALLATIELTSGRLCINTGFSAIRGRSVATV